MARNIFLLDEAVDREDRLTFAWGWLLNLLPATLGQAFCDLVAVRTGLPPAKFQSVTDHPEYGPNDHPDMLLSTNSWRIVFEHKLAAPLDNDQLQRYLRLAAAMPGTRVAFMSRTPHEIDEAVLGHPLYLKPQDGNHFLWTDIYPLVVACTSPAATDFEMYLARLGLRPEHWGGLGDPFVAARPEVVEVLAGASNRLRRMGWPARRPSSSRWDIEIRHPLPNIHNAYLKLKPSMEGREPNVPGRAIEMILWTKPDGGMRYLPRVSGQLSGRGAPVFVRPDWKNKRMGQEFKGELFFTSPLKEVLGESRGSAIDGVAEFANRVLCFARDGGEVISQS